jgi:hypothetical protein
VEALCPRPRIQVQLAALLRRHMHRDTTCFEPQRQRVMCEPRPISVLPFALMWICATSAVFAFT